MKPSLPIAALIACLLFVVPDSIAWSSQWPGRQELLSKDVEGISVVKNSDLAKAREEAIKDALQKAVIETEGSLSTREDSKSQPRQSNAERYVRSYRILNEKQAGFIYTVSVNVVVDVALLVDDRKAGSVKQPAKKIILTVLGVTNYVHYRHLKDYLETHVRHCGRLSPQMIAWHVAEFKVDICESSQDFANTLARFGPFALHIKQVVADAVEVEISAGNQTRQ